MNQEQNKPTNGDNKSLDHSLCVDDSLSDILFFLILILIPLNSCCRSHRLLSLTRTRDDLYESPLLHRHGGGDGGMMMVMMVNMFVDVHNNRAGR